MLSKKTSIVLVFAVLVAFAACASAAPEDVKYPSRTVDIKKVAILPLADYSNQNSFVEAAKWGGNRRVVEYLKNEFEARGIEVAPQEGVIKMLLDSGAIKVLKQADTFGTPEYDLIHSPHWELMTKELFKKINPRQETTTALSKQKIAQIGQALGADVVVRGELLHYELRQKPVINAFEDIIPFLMMQGDKQVYAYANAPDYEKDIYDRFKITSLHDYGMVFPLNEKSSGIIVVIYYQDAKTGKIIHKGAAEVPYPDKDFNANLSKAVSSVFKDIFRINNYGYLYIKQ